jgi:hypothetical protein
MKKFYYTLGGGFTMIFIRRMFMVTFVMFVLCFATSATSPSHRIGDAQDGAVSSSCQVSRALPLYFVSNRGQLDGEILFHLKMSQGNVLYSKNSILYQFVNGSPETSNISRKSLRVRFEGANNEVEALGLEKSQARFNFYRGNNPENWTTAAPAYHRIRYVDLYPNIDLVVFEQNALIKQEFHVKQGGAVEDIRLRYEGADSMEINQEGQLEIRCGPKVLIEDTPLSYQVINGKKVIIPSEYVMEGKDRIRFRANSHNPRHTLVIDPSLLYSTFLGGKRSDDAEGIAVDLHLNAYIVGTTWSPDFPTTPGAYDNELDRPDVFLTKLNPSGSEILFSTFLGGSKEDFGRSIAFSWLDDCPVIVGDTKSHDFPTTPGAYDRSYDGWKGDIFITKFTSSGSLVFSSFFGGFREEENPEVALDGSGNIYVYGVTQSPTDFPTTPGAFDSTFDRGYYNNLYDNLFVAKFSPDGANLLYSTLFGTVYLTPGGIAVDFSGNAFIAGVCWWGTDNVPTTSGVYREQRGSGTSGSDGFVASIDPTGTRLNYCTYIGFDDENLEGDGLSYDQDVNGIAVDGRGRAFIAGTNYDDGFHAGFIFGFNAAGTNKLLIRQFGVGSTEAHAVSVDGRGALYSVFETREFGLETSDDAFQKQYMSADLYIVKLKISDGSTQYATYFGGSGTEISGGFTVDSFGSAYITGTTYSFDLPTTPGAYSTVPSPVSRDTFVARIRDSGPQGELSLNKTKVTLKVPYQNTNTKSTYLLVGNKGKGIVNYDITTDKNWLKIWPESGDVRNEKDKIGIKASPVGLLPGTHKGIFKVSSSDAFNSPHQAIISLKIGGPTIKLRRKKCKFTVAEGSTVIRKRNNAIKNKGPGTLRYKLTAMDPWLTVTRKKGVSTGEWNPFTMKANPSGLEAGIYQGTIEITSEDTVDSPVLITVILNVVVPASQPNQ